ncbi:NTPase, partial [Xanthomonas perforans]|nr:NTPase [Xanthomonas perforans]
MTGKIKLSVAIALLLLALIAGVYLSGQLILMLLKVAGPLSFDTYW